MPLQTGKATEDLQFLLFIVLRPILGRDYLGEFLIHFISSVMLHVSMEPANIKSLLSYMFEPPFKKGRESFKNKNNSTCSS